MIVKAALAAVLTATILSTIPLPYSEEGAVIVPPGGSWTYPLELSTRAHVTCNIRADVPVDIRICEGAGPSGEMCTPPITESNGTNAHRGTADLAAGQYWIVIMNNGEVEAKIRYHIHEDFVVVANMTAKNVMGLSLALSMIIVALFLYGRPRRP